MERFGKRRRAFADKRMRVRRSRDTTEICYTDCSHVRRNASVRVLSALYARVTADDGASLANIGLRRGGTLVS